MSDEETINRENSSIRYALFAVINKLPEDAFLPEAKHAKQLKIALFMIAAVAIFAIVAFNLEWFKVETPNTVAATPTTASSVATPVIESPQTPITPITPIAPVDTPKIVADTLLKADTLRKKKVRRVKKNTQCHYWRYF